MSDRNDDRLWNKDRDDDRPRRRDDDDDRPRRRRDREDDDYDDRPRRRGSRSSGGSSAVVVVVVGAVVLVVGAAALMILPAVQKVRGAAVRLSDQNNMKQIGLAFHSYNDANQRFPPAHAPVSWRAHLLPYVEYQNVYQMMNVNAPWDDPINRAASNTRIAPYLSKADPTETTGTRYRVFVGARTLYPADRDPLTVRDVTDGLSNTLFDVEASELVPWAAPRELEYDREGPLPPLGVPDRRGFNAGMMDGSVRFVSEKMPPELIRGGIEPNDGRLFPFDQ